MTELHELINVDELVAIDVHTHANIDQCGHTALPDTFTGASGKYFNVKGPRHPSIDDIAAYYRERRMAAVVFTVDAEAFLGHDALSNEEIAESARKHSDVLIPFASIDPHKGAAGVRAARRLVTEHGVRGFKFHPSLQGFAPNDRMAFPLYDAIQELGVPALFHTGQTGIGARLPGGGGVRLKYADPMMIDDVAVDFPDMTIIMAHPSFPWQDEALSVANHKQKVYIDLSGWSPKYFPPQLVQYANSLLQDKVLFGSDYPLITPDRWMEDFAKLTIKDEVKPKIMRDNAARLFGLLPGSET